MQRLMQSREVFDLPGIYYFLRREFRMNQGKKTAVEAVEEKRGLICQLRIRYGSMRSCPCRRKICRLLLPCASAGGLCCERKESAEFPPRFPPALEREAPELEFLRSMMLCQACPGGVDAQSRRNTSQGPAATAAATTCSARGLWVRPLA